MVFLIFVQAPIEGDEPWDATAVRTRLKNEAANLDLTRSGVLRTVYRSLFAAAHGTNQAEPRRNGKLIEYVTPQRDSHAMSFSTKERASGLLHGEFASGRSRSSSGQAIHYQRLLDFAADRRHILNCIKTRLAPHQPA
jgi:hypothetical protein